MFNSKSIKTKFYRHRSFYIILISITILALLFRLYSAFEHRDYNPAIDNPPIGNDMEIYQRFGNQMAKGEYDFEKEGVLFSALLLCGVFI